jgi:hypothetical protein
LTQTQQTVFILVETLLPGLLLALLVALVAILGITRWRRILGVLASLALLLLFIAILIFQIASHPGSGETFAVNFIALQWIGQPALIIMSSLSTVGAFLSLVLAARANAWYWFAVLLATTIVSAAAFQFTFGTFPLFAIVGNERAQELLQTPVYIAIAAIFAAQANVARLIFAVFSHGGDSGDVIVADATEVA